ncbi:tryptophan synthase subunit alpha [Candidatus Saganbacteria bacterium]|nr:tryptophan synthase subunit alpha [Candidatus Saganbacteria bacterium]
MSKITDAFKKRKALIPFIVAGDPSLAVTEKLVYQLEEAGADIIELGIPFSDPLADGPVIQAAHARAIKVSLAQVFSLVKKIRKRTAVPIIFMLSDNLIEKYGASKFYDDCKKFGVDGVIVPDLPPEESPADNIYLIAPTTTEERIKRIASASTGFIYLVSVMGITGARRRLSGDLGDLANRVRKFTDKPIAVGFGISNPAQAKEAAKSADGVIVGSALVELIAQKQFTKAIKLVANLRKALDAR